jgi:putative ABC transport system substrate-binding protein
VKRREFITVLGGVAFVSPLSARAQQPDRVRRIAVLMLPAPADPQGETDIAAFTQGLNDTGWSVGSAVEMEVRWARGDIGRMRTLAKELVALHPEVILSHGTAVTAVLQKETATIPLVFVGVSDPVGSGFVAGLPNPGGNITGFINLEAQMGGKWLELLMEIAPGTKRVVMLFNPDMAAGRGSYYRPSFEAAARAHNVATVPAPVESDAEIEGTLTALAGEPDGGLVVMPDTFTFVHRAAIIRAAARNNIPAVYWDSPHAREGGLLSYGISQDDLFRRSAAYIDLILRGAKPAALPVQLPTKFEMILNLKTAKALSLSIPASIQLRADEVIE